MKFDESRTCLEITAIAAPSRRRAMTRGMKWLLALGAIISSLIALLVATGELR
jgi:hypothetical protein